MEETFVRCQCDYQPTHHGDLCKNHVEVFEDVVTDPALCLACLYTCEDE